ncbi:hypothetical protein KVA01_16840 [Kocuria varians]|uniref:Acetone carboxylase n=1 Tax=Kocuria varians TaxID=1272 RepID=A0A4Y4D6C1_KOCVA|nr:hypothetical protein [Kocuria varians]GEC99529.1 hypothetical protein KVA01_16840 [Kocuria varians]
MELDLLGSLDPQRPAGSPTPSRSEEDVAPRAVCSRRGCRAPARWTLLWNNPRVHTPERRKAWLACDAHREHLADFLGQRGFLKSVEPFDDGAAVPGAAGPGTREGSGVGPGGASSHGAAGRGLGNQGSGDDAENHDGEHDK